VLAPESKHVAMRLCTYIPTACEVAQKVVSVMDDLGMGKVRMGYLPILRMHVYPHVGNTEIIPPVLPIFLQNDITPLRIIKRAFFELSCAAARPVWWPTATELSWLHAWSRPIANVLCTPFL
jgi:hypothetical protein